LKAVDVEDLFPGKLRFFQRLFNGGTLSIIRGDNTEVLGAVVIPHQVDHHLNFPLVLDRR
jgi:hypothetical protein